MRAWSEAVEQDVQRRIISLLRSTPAEVEQRFRDVAEAGPDYFVDIEETVLYPSESNTNRT